MSNPPVPAFLRFTFYVLIFPFPFGRRRTGFSFFAWSRHHLLLELHRYCSRTRRVKDYHVVSGHGELVATRLRTHHQEEEERKQKKHLPGQQPKKTLDPLHAHTDLGVRGLGF